MTPTSFLWRAALWLLGIALMAIVGACGEKDAASTSDRSVSLSDAIDVAEDPSGSLTFEEVTSSKRATLFKRQRGPLNFGLSRSVFWFRLNLDSATLPVDDGRQVVTLGASLDQIGAFFESDVGGVSAWEPLKPIEPPQKGFSARSYELPTARAGSISLLFRVQSLDTIVFSPRLTSMESYVTRRNSWNLRKGAYYGLMFGAIGYNLFLAIWLRDRAYFSYVLFETVFGVTMSAMDRTIAVIWPWLLPHLRDGLTEQLINCTSVVAVLFARDFLDLRREGRFSLGSRITVIIGLLLILSPVVIGRQAFVAVTNIFTICTTALVVFMAFDALRRGNRNALLFMIALGALISVVVAGALTNLGLMMPKFDIIDAIRVGSAGEALLFAAALAHRMSSMRRAEADARAALAEARLGLSQVLQRQVTSLNTLVGGVAHEIGNPLNFASGGARDVVERLTHAEALTAELLLDWNPRRAESLREILGTAKRSAGLAARGTERIDGIVKNLRAYVGTGSQPAEPTDIDECIRSTVTLLDRHLKSKQVDVILDLALATSVQFCPGEMNQVIMNLVLNACQAMPEGGQIHISSEQRESSLRVVVADTGPGVPLSRRQAIFDPFFTTRAPNEGTGLGLAVSLEIVRRHGGKLELLPAEPHHGAEFVISLPRSQ